MILTDGGTGRLLLLLFVFVDVSSTNMFVGLDFFSSLPPLLRLFFDLRVDEDSRVFVNSSISCCCCSALLCCTSTTSLSLSELSRS